MNLSSIEPELARIPIALIDEPQLPSRSEMDDAKMGELVAAIRTQGFTSTIVVARVGDRYEVIAGHRRRIAAGLAPIDRVPCLVFPSRDVALEAVKHGENKHREDLNPGDEAIYLAQLLERDCDGDTDRLAAQVGESRGYVEGRLALLYGDDDVFAALRASRIRVGVAQQLNRCTDIVHRRYLLDLALKSEATISTVAGWIEEWKRVHAPATRNLQPGAAAATSGPPMVNDYFTCHLCDTKDNPGSMWPVQVHDYCIRAILEPALKFWKQKHLYVERPRTVTEAADLVSELLEQFPALGGEESASA